MTWWWVTAQRQPSQHMPPYIELVVCPWLFLSCLTIGLDTLPLVVEGNTQLSDKEQNGSAIKFKFIILGGLHCFENWVNSEFSRFNWLKKLVFCFSWPHFIYHTFCMVTLLGSVLILVHISLILAQIIMWRWLYSIILRRQLISLNTELWCIDFKFESSRWKSILFLKSYN